MKKILLLSIIALQLIAFTGCDTQENEPNLTSQLTLSHNTLSLIPGEVSTITAQVTPVTNNAVTWETADKNIATVFYGKITAQNQGSTYIIARSGDLVDSCLVTVALKPYQLVWSEEFEGTELNSENWNIETGGGGWGNQEKQHYTARSENLRIANGLLYIEARKENYGSNNYTSARITTKNKASFAYGKIEARIKLPSGEGTWPAFWMLGYGSWPMCGEIDIMEHVGSNPNMISHAVHTAARNGNNGMNWHKQYYTENVEGQFRTYSIEWEKAISNGDDYIKFYVDDTLTATLWQSHGITDKSQWPFNNEFFIILNMAIGGNMGGNINDAIFDAPVVMEVDWVRVYQRQ